MPHHPALARLSSGSARLAAAFGLLLLASLLVLHLRPAKPLVGTSDGRRHPDPAALFLSLSPGANTTIAADLRALTAGPHLAGTPASAGPAAHVLARFRAAGLQTLTRDYRPLLSYPAGASLALLRADGSLLARLSTDEPADAGRRFVRPYHAYAPSGGAVAEAVFVNLGREEDYLALERLGVGVRGRVAVAVRGGGYRGGVVARAAERGAVAVLIAGHADGGVERGTVLLGGPGDPLTPGWAVTAGAERLGLDNVSVKRRFPTIPSMPISFKTAVAIVRSLAGPDIPAELKSGLGVDNGRVGPGPALVNFTYQEDKKLATIRNVFAVIKGYEEPDRYVILGNHRDAWTYGAVDPNSGTAALLNIAQRLGIMLQSGWTPRRTIILCSWDAEEFGMIGSTEWVEENLADLHSKAVAYLNVDCAVQGVGLFAGSTPQLDKLLVDVTRQVKDPDVMGKMVHDTWKEMNGGINIAVVCYIYYSISKDSLNLQIERLARTDSDFAAFLHHAGIPCVDLYYGEEFPGYHTALDSFNWMERHGDPLFLRHLAITEIWGLLALRLADDPVLPFDYQTYASQIQEHTNAITVVMNNSRLVNLMNECISDLSRAAMEILKEAKLCRTLFVSSLVITSLAFVYLSQLYSPPEDYESKLSFFPGIADAISQPGNLTIDERQVVLKHEVWKISRAIQRAASVLSGEFSQQKESPESSVVVAP
ncbi:hypothetical protein PR202_gb10691 [Eleusine coracana subsp. coracana]|uniref:glutamate carboxypeptidase II n=1 Tax=Eleusine coracana subsp. coracana TaxID=191504 RepID=A0AAV5EKL6_ELECO|nr:hypothetical protein PR202_gb10691 [Eleusine coracana subsp. coracana]